MLAFEKKVEQYILQQQLLKGGSHLLVACSGGVDSMALLHFLHKKKSDYSIQLSCVHVDHMLRGEESYEDLQFVKVYCEEQGIPFYGKSIPIPEIIERDGGNVQAICRKERYNYFEQIMQQIKSDFLVTAHHADDQVETVLMSITKNSSITGLKGIEPIRKMSTFHIIRPFLAVTKVEIREYSLSKKLGWREDVSNAKNVYMRNRFRNKIIPLMQQENEQLATNILQLTEQIRNDDTFIMELAREKFADIVTISDKNRYVLSVRALKGVPLALQRRLVLILLNYIYGKYHTYQTYQLVQSILSLCHTQKGHNEVHLPEQFIATRSYDELLVQKVQPELVLSSVYLKENEWVKFGEYSIFLCNLLQHHTTYKNSKAVYYFNNEHFDKPLFVRSFQQGDRIHLPGMEQAKRISRIFIDEKIPIYERQRVPIIATEDEIVTVGSIRHSKKISKSKRPFDNYVIIMKDDSL